MRICSALLVVGALLVGGGSAAQAAIKVGPSQQLAGRATQLDVAADGSVRLVAQSPGGHFAQLTAPAGGALGGPVRLPTGARHPYALDYAADRSGLALASTGPGGADTQVVAFGADGHVRRRFVLRPRPATQASLAVAGDGSALIAWGSRAGGHAASYLLARVGHSRFGPRQRLAARTAYGAAFAVAAHGAGLLVTDQLSSRRFAQTVRDGRLGPPRSLEGVVAAVPAVARDGTGVLALVESAPGNRYALAAATAPAAASQVPAPRALEQQVRGLGEPPEPTADIAPDDTAIVTWKRDDRTVVREGAGFAVRTLLPVAQGTGLVRVGPGGELLAFGGGGGGLNELAVSLRPAGSSTFALGRARLRVATGVAELGVSGFTPDGGALFAVTPVNAIDQGRSEVFRVTPATG